MTTSKVKLWITVAIATFAGRGANALNPALKYYREKWNPEDPYNAAWSDGLHDYIMEMSDCDTFNNAEMHEEGRLPEHDVVEMTDEMYSEIFNGAEPPKDNWYIAFIRKRRSQEQFWQAMYVVNSMRVLADELQGEIRFAFVDSRKSEKLKETFGVRTLPQQFFYKDGVWYEQNMMQILYNNIRKFTVEQRYTNSDQVYQEFETPTLITEWQLKLKYVYNWIWKQWFDTYSYTVSDFFRETIIYDDKNFYKTFPQLADFFKMLPPDQVNIVCAVLLSAILLLIATLWLALKCARWCCCGKKPTADAAAPSGQVSDESHAKTD